MTRAQRGDRAAFAELYADHVRTIHGVCLGILRRHHDAAEATAEAFLRAMEHLPALRDPAAFSAWLRSIARRAALGRLAEARRTVPLPEHLDVPAAPGGDPESAAEHAELSALVDEAARTLHPRYREVFELHLRRGWSAERVADALGITTAHAYVLVMRTKESLRQGLRAVVMARGAHHHCPALDAISREFGPERSPRMRQAVLRHVRGCPSCTARVHPALTGPAS